MTHLYRHLQYTYPLYQPYITVVDYGFIHL